MVSVEDLVIPAIEILGTLDKKTGVLGDPIRMKTGGEDKSLGVFSSPHSFSLGDENDNDKDLIGVVMILFLF